MMIGSSLLVEDVVDGGGAGAVAGAERASLELREACGLCVACEVARVERLR